MPPTSKAIAGFTGFLDISEDGGATFIRFGELRELTLTIEMDPIDVTSHDTAPWREFITGLKQFTGSAEGLYIDPDVGQDAVRSALLGSTELKARFIPKVGSGLPRFDGDILITNYEQSMPNDDADAVSIEIQGNGALTDTAQA